MGWLGAFRGGRERERERERTNENENELGVVPSSRLPHIRICRWQQDPTPPRKGLALQLLISINIPEKYVESDDIEQEDIPIMVRFFSDPGRSEIYCENICMHAWGSF